MAFERNGAGSGESIAPQLPGRSHRAKSANAPLPAFANRHPADAPLIHAWPSDRILCDLVVVILKSQNTQVTLGFDYCLKFPDEWR
jgi:hypothetical protein